MRLEWIEDILAVLDTGSFANAAPVRNLTQSAFTRRIRTIEENIGAPLFDRSKKPVELLHHVKTQEPLMRSLVMSLHELRSEFTNAGATAALRVSLACQHSLAMTISPALIKNIVENKDISVRVSSANRDACLMMLLSGSVDFAIIFRTTTDENPAENPAFIEATLQSEMLLPVASMEFLDSTRHRWATDGIPIISYPSDVFLGQQMRTAVYPVLHSTYQTQSAVETALTLAAAQYAAAGLGVAWIPASVAEEYFQSNKLINLANELTSHELHVTLTALSTKKTDSMIDIWNKLKGPYAHELRKHRQVVDHHAGWS